VKILKELMADSFDDFMADWLIQTRENKILGKHLDSN
jgi:hypothetical protein